MEQVRHYQPRAVEFPESITEEQQIHLERVDEDAVHKHLYQSLPLPDLMRWLTEHYGHYQDITLLRLYHKLIRLPDISATPDTNETRIALKQVIIRLHSHTLESL
jgi:hypothetical protein